MNAACSNCGKSATRACIHEECDILPFMCDGQCQIDTGIDQRLYHKHDNQIKCVVWKTVTKKVEDIQGIVDHDHNSDVEKKIRIIIGDLQRLIERYQSLLMKSAIDLSADVQLIMHKIQSPERNHELTGKELGFFLKSKEVCQHRIKDKRQSNLLKREMKDVLEILNNIRIETFFNQQAKTLFEKQAKKLSSEGLYKKAIAQLQLAKKSDPLNAKYRQAIGYAYFKLNKNKEAFQYLEESINMGISGQDLSLTHFNLGVLYETEGKPTKANKQYSKAILANEKNAEAYFRRGNTSVKGKKYQEAIQDYSKAIQIEPEEISYFEQRANAYLQVQNYTMQQKDLQTIQELKI